MDVSKEHASLPEYESCWKIKRPEAIDTVKIEANGGSWIQLENGRIVEYYVCGSKSPDATVLVDCHGGNCTGQMFSLFTESVSKCMETELNIKVISPTQPGFGYSTIQPERKIKDWPKTDLLPILEKENVTDFIVSGVSFGTPHALATALEFAEKKDGRTMQCHAMGLRVPYLGSESCRELKLKNHFSLGYTSKSANTTMLGNKMAKFFTSMQKNPSHAFDTPGCMMKTFMECLNPGALGKIEKLICEHPELMKQLRVGMDKSVEFTTQGILYNYATETLIDHGFDVRNIPKELPLVVWYAKDDEDCPPSHGSWLASGEHFTNVKSERIFEGYGHVGAAFLDFPLYLEELTKAMIIV